MSNPIGVTAPGSEDEEGEEQEESSVGAPRGTLERRVGALRIRTWSKTPPLARDLMMTLETYMMILETHRPVLDPPGASVTAFCTPTSRVSEHGIKQDMSIVERHFSSAPLANSCQRERQKATGESATPRRAPDCPDYGSERLDVRHNV